MDSFRYCACELKLRLGSGLGACEFYVIVWFERFGMQGRGGEGTKIWLGMRGEMGNGHGEASRDHLGGVKLQTTADIFSNNATRSTVVFCSGDNCLWNLKPQSLYSSSYSSS